MGEVLLAADALGAVGVWFEGAKHYARCLDREHRVQETPVLCRLKRWLDIYFSGREPSFTPPLSVIGTPFQREVWGLLLQIPYGSTVTYGEIAEGIARRRRLSRMSAQAVGSAVGKNNLSLVIPCHRVIAANGQLGGYDGGLDRKRYLLTLEHARSDL